MVKLVEQHERRITLEDVTFKVGEIGPFKGQLRVGGNGHPELLKFENIDAGPQHLGALHEITILRSGQPDLQVAGTGDATFSSSDEGRTCSGEIPLRDK